MDLKVKQAPVYESFGQIQSSMSQYKVYRALLRPGERHPPPRAELWQHVAKCSLAAPPREYRAGTQVVLGQGLPATRWRSTQRPNRPFLNSIASLCFGSAKVALRC